VTLLDRQNISVAERVWKQYTELYYLRLLGTSNKARSTDFTSFRDALAASEGLEDIEPIVRELPARDLPQMTPSLGTINVRMMWFIWDWRTMIFTVELSRGFIGITIGEYHDIDPISNVDAHIVVGTLHRSQTTAWAARDLIRRWKAKDTSQGKVEDYDIGVNAWFCLPGDVRPVLDCDDTSDSQSADRQEEAMTVSTSYSASDAVSEWLDLGLCASTTSIDVEQDIVATLPPVSGPLEGQTAEHSGTTSPGSSRARDIAGPDSPDSILAIAQPDEEDTQSSPKAFENSSSVSTHQTLDPAAITVEDEQRQHWKTLAVNAESFCVRFDNRKMTEFIFEVCGNPWIKPKEAYYLFDKIAEQALMETEFSVNLIHRRDIAILPDAWNEYTNLYEARLLGVHDLSNSDDYSQYLAGLKEQDLRMDETPAEILDLLTRADTPPEMPSLGVIKAKIHHLG